MPFSCSKPKPLSCTESRPLGLAASLWCHWTFSVSPEFSCKVNLETWLQSGSIVYFLGSSGLPLLCHLWRHLGTERLDLSETQIDQGLQEILAWSIHYRASINTWREVVQLSDSLQPHGLQAARLLCSRDFPGKNTGVGYHFLLQSMPESVLLLDVTQSTRLNQLSRNKLSFCSIHFWLPHKISFLCNPVCRSQCSVLLSGTGFP